LLVRAGDDGLSVGEIQEHLGIPGSTLSHHILFLSSANLIFQERTGRILCCRPNFERMHAIVNALTAECCKGVGRAAAAPAKKGSRKVLAVKRAGRQAASAGARL
jgi:DNA-binding transcriptional ArsR family regulator